MKEYTTSKIRNVALVAHSGAGKTMLSEAMLHFTGGINRMGKIQDGSTVSDFEDEEIRRSISLSTSVIPVEYKDHKINFLDTPGFTDFVGEMISALYVSDSAVVVVDSVSGAEVGTEIAWNYCDELNLPRFLVINKMDRENADFRKALASVEAITEQRLIPVQLPWGEKTDFKGVIDLLTMKAYAGAGDKGEDIPADYADAAEEAHMELIEAAAEGDDALMEKYFEEETLSAEDIVKGLSGGVMDGSFVPVFVSAATSEIGLVPLLDAVVALMPSPEDRPAIIAQGKSGKEELTASDAGPLAAYVWKTTADPFVGKITYMRVFSGVVKGDSRVWNQNKEEEERFGNVSVMRGKEQLDVDNVHAGDIFTVPKLGETATGDTLCDKGHPLTMPSPEYPTALYRVAVHPESQADAAKMGPTLTRLCEEDMTLSWYNEAATKQTILQGMGDQHIDVAIRKASEKFQANLVIESPRVPYQETITRTGSAQYRHKKQTGGSGQFGEVHLRVEPNPESNYEFANEVFGGAVSNNYMPAIEKGVKSVMERGVIAGYPVQNVKVAVFDGKEHPVDSKPVAFEVAAREAFKLAVQQAGAVLLEPIMRVRVTVPEANMGDIMGDMNTRRGRVQGMDTDKGRSVVTADVPLAEMLNYTTELRSMTGGRGVFTMEYNRHEQVPSHLAQEIIAAEQKRREEDES
ncbi:MAG: elongation factor G [Anaerolineales bacterium]|nr:elongation factor G [Anaerolineales bacterium]